MSHAACDLFDKLVEMHVNLPVLYLREKSSCIFAVTSHMPQPKKHKACGASEPDLS